MTTTITLDLSVMANPEAQLEACLSRIGATLASMRDTRLAQAIEDAQEQPPVRKLYLVASEGIAVSHRDQDARRKRR